MKFKDLTDEIKAKFAEIYINKELTWDERMTLLTKLVGKSERTVRKWAKF